MNEYRALMLAITVICGLACAGGIWPVVDLVMTVVVSVLIGAALVAAAGAAARRELRIRRRLAAIVPHEPAVSIKREVSR